MLGAIGPAARPGIPALTKLLQDPDLDVRLAAVAVLQALDPNDQGPPEQPGQPKARTPQSRIPMLIERLTNDEVEMRLAVMHTLALMGAEARPAVPALAVAVRDPKPRVRLAAVRALGAIGPAARTAADTVRQALKDDDAEVQPRGGRCPVEPGT